MSWGISLTGNLQKSADAASDEYELRWEETTRSMSTAVSASIMALNFFAKHLKSRNVNFIFQCPKKTRFEKKRKIQWQYPPYVCRDLDVRVFLHIRLLLALHVNPNALS